MKYIVTVKTQLSYGEYGAIYHITRRAFATKEAAAVYVKSIKKGVVTVVREAVVV